MRIYKITIDNFSAECNSYREITLKIPVPTADSWKQQTVTVLALQDAYNRYIHSFIVQRSDRERITTALDCGAEFKYHDRTKRGFSRSYCEACLELYNACFRSSLEGQALDACEGSRAVYVNSLTEVTEQFAAQDAKEKRIREEAMRQRQEQEAKKRAEQKKKREEQARQRQEWEAEQKRLREEQLSRIAADRKVYAQKITEEFDRLALLRETALPAQEKITEYNRLKAFCRSYIPDLSVHGFKLESLLEQYPDYIPAADCGRFTEDWKELCKSCAKLQRGAEGEGKVREVLELYDDRVFFLQNFTSQMKTWRCEHDFVVISPFGIFTIEVKNLWGNQILTETGILRSASEKEAKGKDVVLQSKRHLETLRRTLKGCPVFHDKIPLQEIICSANADFTLKDQYGYLPVCYYNTLDKYILPPGASVVLEQETMENIRDYLRQQEIPPICFDLFQPHGEFRSREAFIMAFSAVAGGLQCALDRQKQGEAAETGPSVPGAGLRE